MTDNNMDPLSEDNIPDKAKFADEKTEIRVHQHLTNKNDVISEEDIKNIRTDLNDKEESIKETSVDELKKAEKDEERKQNDDDQDDHSIISSWNILDI